MKRLATLTDATDRYSSRSFDSRCHHPDDHEAVETKDLVLEEHLVVEQLAVAAFVVSEGSMVKETTRASPGRIAKFRSDHSILQSTCRARRYSVRLAALVHLLFAPLLRGRL